MYQIDWSLFLGATTRQKCDKLLSRLMESLPFALFDVEVEPYWKEEHQFKVIARSEVDAPTSRDAFYEIMRAASHVASSWTVNAPPDELDFEVHGASSPGTIKVQGIEAVFFNAAKKKVQAAVRKEASEFT